MTREAILEQLKSSKFSDFANGIENTGTYFKESGYDEQLFENVLTVFTYHLDHKHEEIEAAYERFGRNFRLFFIVVKTHEDASDMFSRGQIEGLSTFLSNFKEGKLDISGYFLATGFIYQLAAQSCHNVMKFVDRNEYPEEYEALEMFHSVFGELWKLQMTAQGIIRETTVWDDYSAIYLFNNILDKADLESQSRMMAGLSAHEGNTRIQQKIVDNYMESLDWEVKKLEAQKKQVEGVKERIIEWFPA
ncbi:hypothetical protein [Chryseobacterium sp. 2987]|uniref:hypothetical protein n=1 Tax=Chryseobacterium sp. 2987 TaxID=2817767 RepID=UPI00285DE5A6|nr:hypothetical protein [Chryseobacterium sp. 2987]MDR6919738.1 hypothetical protein [Chryseobacterium sp. 2987]